MKTMPCPRCKLEYPRPRNKDELFSMALTRFRCFSCELPLNYSYEEQYDGNYWLDLVEDFD